MGSVLRIRSEKDRIRPWEKLDPDPKYGGNKNYINYTPSPFPLSMPVHGYRIGCKSILIRIFAMDLSRYWHIKLHLELDFWIYTTRAVSQSLELLTSPLSFYFTSSGSLDDAFNSDPQKNNEIFMGRICTKNGRNWDLVIRRHTSRNCRNCANLYCKYRF